MAQRRKSASKKPYKGYTGTEQDLLNFGKWFLLMAFIFLVIAAIITTSTKLMIYSVIVGAIVAYGVYHDWFNA